MLTFAWLERTMEQIQIYVVANNAFAAQQVHPPQFCLNEAIIAAKKKKNFADFFFHTSLQPVCPSVITCTVRDGQIKYVPPLVEI